MGIYVIIILISIYSLILENRSAHTTLLWMYVLLCFPLIGYLFYLFSGQLYLKGYLFKSKRRYDQDKSYVNKVLLLGDLYVNSEARVLNTSVDSLSSSYYLDNLLVMKNYFSKM